MAPPSTSAILAAVTKSFGKTIKSLTKTTGFLVGSFGNLLNTVSSLALRFTFIGGAVSAAVFALNKFASSIDKQSKSTASGTITLMQAVYGSYEQLKAFTRRFQNAAEAAALNVGSDIGQARSSAPIIAAPVLKALGNARPGNNLTDEDLVTTEKFVGGYSVLLNKLAETGGNAARATSALSSWVSGNSSLAQLSVIDLFGDSGFIEIMKQVARETGRDIDSKDPYTRTMIGVEAFEKLQDPGFLADLSRMPSTIMNKFMADLFTGSGADKGGKGLFNLEREIGKDYGQITTKYRDPKTGELVETTDGISTGIEAISYALLKFQEAISRIANAFGIAGEPMEVIIPMIISVGKWLTSVADWITGLDAAGKPLKNAKGELVGSKVEYIRYALNTVADVFNFIGDTLSFIIKGTTAILSSIGQAKESIENGSAVEKAFASFNLDTNAIGEVIGGFINNTLDSFIKLTSVPEFAALTTGIGYALGQLVNSLMATFLKIDLGKVAQALLLGLGSLVAVLIGFIVSLNWADLINTLLKGLIVAVVIQLGVMLVSGFIAAAAASLGAMAVIPGIIVFLLIGLLVQLAVWIYRNWDAVKAAAASFTSFLVKGFLNYIAALKFVFIEAPLKLADFVMKSVGEAFNIIGKLMQGDFVGAWEKLVANCIGFINSIIGFFNGLLSKIPGGIQIPTIATSQETAALTKSPAGGTTQINAVSSNISQQTNIVQAPAGNAAFGNVPSWARAINAEMRAAPTNARPLVANTSELIIPHSRASSIQGAGQRVLNATFAPVINSDIDVDELMRKWKSWFYGELDNIMAAEY